MKGQNGTDIINNHDKPLTGGAHAIKKRVFYINVLIALGTMTLCFILINQATGFFYKSKLLSGPCDLCKELNPHVAYCFDYGPPPITGGPNLTSFVSLLARQEYNLTSD